MASIWLDSRMRSQAFGPWKICDGSMCGRFFFARASLKRFWPAVARSSNRSPMALKCAPASLMNPVATPEPRRFGPPSSEGDDEAAADNIGSNAWAFAPSRTKSGKAILLRNPHLVWTSGYYEAHITVPGVDQRATIDFFRTLTAMLFHDVDITGPREKGPADFVGKTALRNTYIYPAKWQNIFPNQTAERKIVLISS